MDIDNPKCLEMKAFLESIGGFVNGWYPDRPNITDPHFMSIGCGWYPLVQKLIQDLIDAGWNRRILQVKEKFGGLRFYTDGASIECYNLIDKAEEESYKTCEECGSKEVVTTGPLEGGYWIRSLCHGCRVMYPSAG